MCFRGCTKVFTPTIAFSQYFCTLAGSSNMVVKSSLVSLSGIFPSRIHGGIVILTNLLDEFLHDVCM